MTPRHKIDAVKRSVTEFKASPVFNQPEKFTYFLGMRAACKILAGDTAGVTKLMDRVIQMESEAAKGE